MDRKARRALLAAVLLAFPDFGRAQAQDTLTVFKAGDTARAAAVNANFRLLMARINALADANERLAGKLDSLQKARPSAPHADSLDAEIEGIRTRIQLLDTRMDSLAVRPKERVHADSVIGLAAYLAGKAALSHVHAVSHVAGLQDSLQGKVSAKGGPLKVCSGKTAPGVGWVDYNAFSAYLDVDTKACGFASVPEYFTSLGGTNRHYGTTGATSIYSPTATGFRIYLANTPWASPSEAPLSAAWNLHINWVAIGP